MFEKLAGIISRSELPQVVLNPSGKNKGVVAISYLAWPFKKNRIDSRSRGHTNAQEVLAMAKIFVELGFRVDVCDWENADYVPPGDCAIAIDIHGNLERWILPRECKKVLHATGAHWLFQNRAELERLEALRIRKGVALSSRRIVEPSRGSEVADHVTVLGNEFTMETFRFTGKPLTRIPISSAYAFSYPQERDQEKARRKFLWLGSYGMVHKGLDLALEAFAEMPELQLTVCGRPEKEEDFYNLYETELKKTANIHFQGWVDMSSPQFAEIARTHAAVIYPSCSEGGAGSVIHCMHAGLIPVCTTEASVDLGAFGISVNEGSVSAVRNACQRIAGMSPKEIGERSRAAWEHATKYHSLDAFADNYSRFAATLIDDLSR